MAVYKRDGKGDLVPYDRFGRPLTAPTFKTGTARPPQPQPQPESVVSGAPAAPEPDSGPAAPPAASGDSPPPKNADEAAIDRGESYELKPPEEVALGTGSRPVGEVSGPEQSAEQAQGAGAPVKQRTGDSLPGPYHGQAVEGPAPPPKVDPCAFSKCDKPRREKSIYCSQACASKASYWRKKDAKDAKKKS